MAALSSLNATYERKVNNFTEWSLEDNFECYGATGEEMDIYDEISFW
jgi:hypothetical protein